MAATTATLNTPEAVMRAGSSAAAARGSDQASIAATRSAATANEDFMQKLRSMGFLHWITADRKALVRGRRGAPSTSFGVPASTIVPASMKAA